MTSLQLFHLRQSDAIVSHIKRLLNQGILRPGDPIPAERDLARELGFGRGTIREALQQLEALGLIERRNRSRIVRTMTDPPEATGALSSQDQRQFLLQVIDVRIGLEGWVASEVAANASAADVRKLKRLVSELDRAASRRLDLAALDRDFHRALIEATRNPVVLQILNTLMTMISSVAAFKRMNLDPDRKVDTSLHRAIVEAIERRDPTAARVAMVSHLDAVRTAISSREQSST